MPTQKPTIDKSIVHGIRAEEKQQALEEVIVFLRDLCEFTPCFTGSVTVNFFAGRAKDIEKWERTKL